jgi:ubiquinone/menaquinone biosynthesis C-methylase UbiE
MIPAASESQQTSVSGYEHRFVPLGFDVLIAGMFAPFGGVRRLREAALDGLGLEPGVRVLELGCGTGGITRLLLARSAEVTAIDGSAQMLARARTRAPGARFEHQQLESLALPDASFDVALFAFVLHELPAPLRTRALASAVRALAAGGRLAVLDHAVPQARGLARAWRAFLLRLEPPSVAALIEKGFADELQAAGLEVESHERLARGTAQLWVANRSREPR